MKMYGSYLSPYVSRCQMQISAKGLDIELVDPPGGLKSEAYAKINPIRKIPTLDVDGFYIPESEVICEYLEDMYPEPSLRPDDPKERAQVRLISRVVDFYIMLPLIPLFGELRAEKRDQAVIDKVLEEVGLGLDRLNAFIGEQGVAVGRDLSLADCTLVPVLHYVTTFLPMFGAAPLEGRPKVAAYWQAITKTPSAEEIIGHMNAALEKMRAQ